MSPQGWSGKDENRQYTPNLLLVKGMRNNNCNKCEYERGWPLVATASCWQVINTSVGI